MNYWLQCSLHAVSDRLFPGFFQRQSFRFQALTNSISHVLMKRPILEAGDLLDSTLNHSLWDYRCRFKQMTTPNLQLHFDKGADSHVKPPIDKVYKVWKQNLRLLICFAELNWTLWSWASRTDILLGNGVRPSIVPKHLVGQANDTVSFNVTHLVKKPQKQLGISV